MRNVESRLSKLEHQHGLARNKALYLMILLNGDGMTAEEEAYVDRLVEEGAFPGGGFAFIDLPKMPAADSKAKPKT